MTEKVRPWLQVDDDEAPWHAYPIEIVMEGMVVKDTSWDGEAFAVRRVEEAFDGGIWLEGDGLEPVAGMPAVDLWERRSEGKRVWVAVCAHCYWPLVASDDEAPGSCYRPRCFLGRAQPERPPWWARALAWLQERFT
jgi:hypothetical protein